MKLQFGLTQELSNTQYAPLAALLAYYEAEKVLEPFNQSHQLPKTAILRWQRSSNRPL
jgi:hypothetical protein